MAYQIYTPMQAPTIPTSIFSSAAERGAKMGTLIDTPETARIKGEMLGKEKALAYEQAEANIELTQENIESANINQERQREALEADKRANKLAPIKEGLAIAGGVMDIVSGVQGIMGNSNKLTMQEQQIELNQIKLRTENAVAEIKNRTAISTAKAADAKAQRSVELMRTQDDINKAISENQPQLVQEKLSTPNFQMLMQEDGDSAASIVTEAFRIGAIDTARKDEFMRSIYANKHESNRISLQSSVNKGIQKAFGEMQTNYDAAHTAVAHHVARVFPEKANDPNYIAQLRVVPGNQYEVKEDGKFVDLDSKPDDQISSAQGSLLIDGVTGRVIADLDTMDAKAVKTPLDKWHLSMQAYDHIQQGNAANAKSVIVDGKLVPVTQQQSNQQPGYAGLKREPKPEAPKEGYVGTDRLIKRDLGTRTIEGLESRATQQAKSPWYDASSWYDKAKSVANRVFPSLVDDVSKDQLADADRASKAMAKNTLKKYKNAGPREKKLIVTKIGQMARDLDMGDIELYSNEMGNSVEDYFFKSEDLPMGRDSETSLTKLYKDTIVNEMESFQQGVKAGIHDPSKMTRAQAEQKQREEAVAELVGLDDMDEVMRHYARITGKSIPGTEKPPEVTKQEISAATTNIGTIKNWSPEKKAEVETVANRVENLVYTKDSSASVKAVIAIESAGDMGRVSWDTMGGKKNVIGLAQVGQSAQDDVNEKFGLNLDRTKPGDNVEIAKLYLQILDSYPEFKRNKELVYAAYNGGPGTIKTAIKLSGYSDNWEEIRKHLKPVLRAQYDAAVMKKGKGDWDPQKKFEEIYAYPGKVIEYEQVFNQLK